MSDTTEHLLPPDDSDNVAAPEDTGRRVFLASVLKAAASVSLAAQLLAACGSEGGKHHDHDDDRDDDHDHNHGHDVSDDDEGTDGGISRACEAALRAPKPAIDSYGRPEEFILRVGYTIPEFNPCQGPLTVTVMANVSINPDDVVNPPGGYDQEIPLDEDTVHSPGEYLMDAGIPRDKSNITSFFLLVTDAQGRQERSDAKIP